MSARRSKGFTLVELMVTLVVLGVLAAIAFPNFTSTIRSNRVSTSNNEIMGMLALARSEAVRNKQGAGICASTKGTACDGTWSDGLMAWSDLDGNGSFNGGDTVLRFAQGSPELAVTGSAPALIAFDARGRRRSAANQQIALAPVKCKAGESNRTLTVNLSGQVRVARGTCS
ncbi:GspH/FimT family pseudopilin [Stenotrophomonas rhizophila]|uniref:GspH/FimT family pseudopilin n=1 Tax=Stenotrophomonas rhizophila TaxID=216778 RepID=UPI001E4FBB0D|nr:GspH/FimT family pseudopilin [Stenotrophomonas rhizophila]MCC7635563.1 GspH/FimT family pseudopilin [Stenotrophomonas rhizophila]MCC7664228.1 GspH/FimT family pseudopilin [Stenotrophomonas rhizophila]